MRNTPSISTLDTRQTGPSDNGCQIKELITCILTCYHGPITSRVRELIHYSGLRLLIFFLNIKIRDNYFKKFKFITRQKYLINECFVLGRPNQKFLQSEIHLKKFCFISKSSFYLFFIIYKQINSVFFIIYFDDFIKQVYYT
jgi:hypothetical protein